MRIFAIRDGNADVPKDLAYLFYYEKDKTFYIELPEGADEWETPLLLSSFVKRGETTVNPYWSKLWVQQRIIPTDRQNIGQVLRDNGLELYDEFDLLMLADGRCAQDEYYLTERKESELPTEIRERIAHRVEDVVPLPQYHLLVFFSGGSIRKVDALPLIGDVVPFAPLLRDPALFETVQVQAGGYGVSWGTTLELSKNDLFESGTPIPLSADDFASFVARRVITTAEACELLGCSRQNIDDLVRRDKLHPVKAGGRTKLFLRSEVKWNSAAGASTFKTKDLSESSGLFLSAVADVYILQVLAGEVREAVDERRVRGRAVRVFPAGEKPGDMERDAVAPPVLQRGDPLYHLPELLFVIVHAGDDEVREFQMAAVRGHHDGILDGFEVSLQYIAVSLFAEGFEVKVHGVCQGQDLLQNFGLRSPVADEDCLQALRLAGFERVPHELVVDEGFVVGERDADVPLRLQFLRQRDELVRGVKLRPDVVVPRLGNLVVLAERAA